MRGLALIATVGIGMILAGPAFAGPWSDPNGRVNFTAPNGWQVEANTSANATTVLTFDGGHDCYLFGRVNAVTANSSPEAVIRTTRDPVAPEAWVATANSVRDLVPNNSAQLTSQSVDASGFWPVQRAQFRSERGDLFASLQSRPGIDLMAFCAAVDGASPALFESVFASVAHPNDAAWQTQATQHAAEREARAAAATTPPAPEAPPPEPNRRRRRDN